MDNDSSGTRLASINRIRVTVTYTSAVVTPAIGASGSPISEADIVGTCKVNNGVGGACNNASGVWATTVANTMDPPLVKPQIDLDWWWRNAKPGPMYPCTEPGNTFPNGFDTNAGATSGNVFAPDNSVNTSAEITPMNASYTCQVKENGVLKGEISWNNATHVLKVFGTIYIDGDIRFDDNGQIVHYQGRAIIYASDDIEFDERVCAGGSRPDQLRRHPGDHVRVDSLDRSPHDPRGRPVDLAAVLPDPGERRVRPLDAGHELGPGR